MKSTLKIIVLLCLVYLTYQGSFQCNVQGCQYCSFPNFCGQCQPNNLLVWSNTTNTFSCSPLTCAANCATCYVNNTCQVCISGYFLTQTGTCSQQQTAASSLPINCLWGSSSTNCLLCQYGYVIKAGFCYPIIQPQITMTGGLTCLVQQAPMICQICNSGYFVGPLGNCILMNQVNDSSCNVQNCAYCTNANTTCSYCMPGYQLTSQNTCANNICNSAGCGACSSNGQCASCILGYNFNTNSKTCQPISYGCSDPNCQICDNPQSCSQCQPGYTNLIFYYNNNVPVKLCRPLPCPYGIKNCAKCTYQFNTLFSYQKVLCAQCNPNYILVNGYCVAQLRTYDCNVANCVSCSFNNFCSKCNNGFILSALGTCYPTQCTNIQNCASCSANYVCQQCNTGYTLSLGFLSMNYQPISDGVASMLNAQCIPNTISCTSIANCAYCLTNGVCASCASGYDFPTIGSTTCSPVCSISNCYQCN